MDIKSLAALANLLKPPEEEQDSEDVCSSLKLTYPQSSLLPIKGEITVDDTIFLTQEIDTRPSPYVNPGSIGPKASADPIDHSPKAESTSKDIWGGEEVSSQQQYEYEDPRPEPE